MPLSYRCVLTITGSGLNSHAPWPIGLPLVTRHTVVPFKSTRTGLLSGAYGIARTPRRVQPLAIHRQLVGGHRSVKVDRR